MRGGARSVTGGDGLAYYVAHGLDALAWADIVFVPGYRFPDRDDPPRAVVDALIAAHDRGARLAAISTGAFALAATGLLDGRRATTHWHYTRALVARHPLVQVDENVLFVDEGSVLTSAGAASGIDLCLHILRGDLGVAASNHAARRLVAAPYRSGGQAQYVPRSAPSRSVSPGEAVSLTCGARIRGRRFRQGRLTRVRANGRCSDAEFGREAGPSQFCGKVPHVVVEQHGGRPAGCVSNGGKGCVAVVESHPAPLGCVEGGSDQPSDEEIVCDDQFMAGAIAVDRAGEFCECLPG